MAAEAADRVRLRAGALALDLAPAIGGAVAAFRADTARGPQPVFRDSPAALSDVLDAACFPLVPFSNRIRDGRFVFRGREVRLAPNMAPQRHPLHGQGWRRPWRVVEADGASAELSFHHDPGEWPWVYEARQRFSLDRQGLSVALSVVNTSEATMPAGLGLHPYFPANRHTILAASVRQVLAVDDEVMPTGVEPAAGRYHLRDRAIERAGLDNGYEGWDGLAELRWPDRGLSMQLSASPAARRFQVYAPIEGGVVVAEPVTHANDAFGQREDRWPELGVKLLEPGERFEMSARFDVSVA